jgi:hypothetical protein
LERVWLLTRYFLKSLIFLIRGDVDKKIQKKRKIKFTKKESWGTNFEAQAIFLPINTGLHNTQGRRQFYTYGGNAYKTLNLNPSLTQTATPTYPAANPSTLTHTAAPSPGWNQRNKGSPGHLSASHSPLAYYHPQPFLLLTQLPPQPILSP